MAKDKNLYFIPILAKAFDSEDPSSAFDDALSEIIRLGQLPEYGKGFTQFEQFVASGFQSLSEGSENLRRVQDSVRDGLLAMMATDAFDGPDEIRDSLIRSIKSNPDLAQCYNKIREAAEEAQPPLAIELYTNDEFLGAQPLSAEAPRVSFDQIEPGNYSLRLSNGRVIWEDKIETKDVIWNVAFPEKAYPMAAATEKDERSRIKSITLLDGQIVLTFYGGFELGSLELVLTKGPGS